MNRIFNIGPSYAPRDIVYCRGISDTEDIVHLWHGSSIEDKVKHTGNIQYILEIPIDICLGHRQKNVAIWSRQVFGKLFLKFGLDSYSWVRGETTMASKCVDKLE